MRGERSAGGHRIPQAKLWDAEHPNLYTCVIKTENDEESVPFGIRTLTWSAKTGLCVNGKTVKLRGGCIHHDNGILGACGFADAEERRIRIMKKAGYNAVRCAHNPASRALLDACDRLGMYVMDEAFDGWYTPKTYHDYSRIFAENWQDDLTAMIAKRLQPSQRDSVFHRQRGVGNGLRTGCADGRTNDRACTRTGQYPPGYSRNQCTFECL